MLGFIFGLSHYVIQIGPYEVLEIIKYICHVSLKSGSNIFKTKIHYTICKSVMGHEFYFSPSCMVNLGLIIPREPQNQGRHLMPSTCVNHLIDEWCREVVSGHVSLKSRKSIQTLIVTLFFALTVAMCCTSQCVGYVVMYH